MSENAIEKYYNEIKEAELNGMNNEQNIREYFYELLKNYTNSQNLKIERETKEFVFENGVLTVQLKKQESPFAWQLVRIQGHRPEDDIAETKF